MWLLLPLLLFLLLLPLMLLLLFLLLLILLLLLPHLFLLLLLFFHLLLPLLLLLLLLLLLGVCTLRGTNKMVSNLNTISPPRCSAPQRAKSAVKFAQIKFWSRSNRNWTIKAPPTKGCWEILFLSFATFVSYISSSHIVYISEKFTPRDTYCSDNEHLKMQQVHKCNNYDQKGLRVPIQKGFNYVQRFVFERIEW